MSYKFLPLTLLLAGCATVNGYKPTMEADASEVGNEGIAFVTEMMDAYEPVPKGERGLCDLVLPSYQEARKDSFKRYETRTGVSAGKSFQCWRFKRKPAAGDVQRYMQSGIALSDLYRDTYFRRIAQHWSQRRFARDTTNDLGAAISAVLGLTKVASPITGGVGAGFGLIDGTFRNYRPNIRPPSPSLDDMRSFALMSA
jgi:hypothetical protein